MQQEAPRGPLFVCGRFRLALEEPLVMGIVNVTPDSFSDGGRFLDPEVAIAHAHRLAAEGADILDIGAESTRPGAAAVDADEELRRLLPVLDALAHGPVPVSVDTMKPDVMAEAIRRGASMINDVNAFRAPGAIDVVRASDVALCIMHMQGEPRTMQLEPRYADVVAEVRAFLEERVTSMREASIDPARIVVDPGFGFGKTLKHNFSLLYHLGEIVRIGLPVLAGWSRKSSLGKLLGRRAEERLPASLAAALIAVQRGARIVRVHDVAATRDVLRVWRAVRESGVEKR